jgi:hypothetical protein
MPPAISISRTRPAWLDAEAGGQRRGLWTGRVHAYRDLGRAWTTFWVEAAPGFEPGDGGFADPCLASWLRRLERLQTGAGDGT